MLETYKQSIKKAYSQILLGRTNLMIWENLSNYIANSPEKQKISPCFIGTTLESQKNQSILALARFYDSRDDCLSADKLIIEAFNLLTKTDKREYLEKELSKWNKRKVKAKPKIKRLKILRNKLLAHNDYNILSGVKKLSKKERLILKEANYLYDLAFSLVEVVHVCFIGSSLAYRYYNEYSDFQNLFLTTDELLTAY